MQKLLEMHLLLPFLVGPIQLNLREKLFEKQTPKFNAYYFFTTWVEHIHINVLFCSVLFCYVCCDVVLLCDVMWCYAFHPWIYIISFIHISVHTFESSSSTWFNSMKFIYYLLFLYLNQLIRQWISFLSFLLCVWL